jgi:hypothetical protein
MFACGLWSAKCTYLTELAYMRAEITNENGETVVNRFFGIFFAMFQISQILGNLISSIILKPESSQKQNLSKISRCGSNDCPYVVDKTDEQPIIIAPELSTVYTLCFVYLILAFLSIILIAFFLDSITSGILFICG